MAHYSPSEEQTIATPHKDSQSSPHLKSALAEFLQAYPAFQTTSYIDDFRDREFSCLDEQGHIYLDYTDGGLYADSQILEHTDILRNRVFGNPHSTEPTSEATTELIERGEAIYSITSTPRQTSMSPYSRPTPPVRLNWWARVTLSDLAITTC